MKGNYIEYDYKKSVERIDQIIEESENSFEELDSIPTRDKLTFTNGFYVNCSCLFVDIRESSNLTEKHNRPKLAKLYRSYISEVVAILNGNPWCVEVNIIGDGISGIFDAKNNVVIDWVFADGARIGTLIDTLNKKFEKKGIEKISVGIGVSYGRALMIKAGYSGSSINEVVWIGDVVNEAFKLGNLKNSPGNNHEIRVSEEFYNKLNAHNKSLLKKDYPTGCYWGTVIVKVDL